MNKSAIIAIIVVIILILIGIFAYNRPSSNNQPVATPTVGTTTFSTTTSTTSSSATAQEKVFTVTGQNFSFSPSTLTVNKGDMVKIVFKNVNGTHDFKIDEFNVATPLIQTGQEATVEFVADKTGTFDYYCSVGNHRAMGMQGTLTVQ